MTTEQDILKQRLATAQYEQETAERARAYLEQIQEINLETARARLLTAGMEAHQPVRRSALGDWGEAYIVDH